MPTKRRWSVQLPSPPHSIRSTTHEERPQKRQRLLGDRDYGCACVRNRDRANSSPTSLPLTARNLLLLNSLNRPDPSNAHAVVAMTSSASTYPPSSVISSSSSGRKSPTKSDQESKLRAHNVFTPRAAVPLPEALTALISDLCDRPREHVSPNAKELVTLQPLAVGRAEKDGFDIIQDKLLYERAYKSTTGQLLEPVVELNLASQYRPPHNFSEYREAKLMERPVPDRAFGYLTRADFERAPALFKSQGLAFTVEEEFILDQLGSLCEYIHTPFFTCQWKACRNGGTHYAGQLQAARDGAVAVNYLNLLSRAALPGQQKVDTANACHFSMTCDLATAYVYVHWLHPGDGRTGPPTYEMQIIKQTFLNSESQVLELRRLLRNLSDWAFETRLPWIKSLLAAISPRLKAGELSKLWELQTRVLPTPSLTPSLTPNAAENEVRQPAKRPRIAE